MYIQRWSTPNNNSTCQWPSNRFVLLFLVVAKGFQKAPVGGSKYIDIATDK